MRSHREIGQHSQLVGAEFESWLQQQHEFAHRLGILAFMEKTEAHAKKIGGHLEFVKPGVADFVGCLCGGGRTLAVEAKSTGAGEDRLERSVVSPKQQVHLSAVAAAGGLSLLLIERRADILARYEHYAVPWLQVPWKVLRTAESVTFADISMWIVKPGKCYLSTWHEGGKQIGTVGAVGGKHRVLARE